MFHRNRCTIFGIVLAACWLVITECRYSHGAGIGTPTEERLRNLSNVSAQVTTTVLYTPFPAAPGVVMRGPPIQGAYGYEGVFRFLDGRAFYDCRLDGATQAQHQELGARVVTVISAERAETLTQHAKLQPNGAGLIKDHVAPPKDSLIDVALGLRLWKEDRWIHPPDLAACNWEVAASGLLVARLRTKQEGDFAIVHKWEFDPKLGYAPVYYSVEQNEPPPYGNFTLFELDCKDFQRIQDLWLPFQIESREMGAERGDRRKPVVYKRQQMQVDGYLIDDPSNTPQSFVITWPAKAIVRDQRSGALIRQPTTGPITDAQIVEGRRRHQHLLDQIALAQREKPGARPWLVGGSAAVLVALAAFGVSRRTARRGR